jgi:hypothetical protein
VSDVEGGQDDGVVLVFGQGVEWCDGEMDVWLEALLERCQVYGVINGGGGGGGGGDDQDFGEEGGVVELRSFAVGKDVEGDCTEQVGGGVGIGGIGVVEEVHEVLCLF